MGCDVKGCVWIRVGTRRDGLLGLLKVERCSSMFQKVVFLVVVFACKTQPSEDSTPRGQVFLPKSIMFQGSLK